MVLMTFSVLFLRTVPHPQISLGSSTNITPSPILYGKIRHQTPHIKKLGLNQYPHHHHHHGHLFSPPSCSQPKPLRPLTDNTLASAIAIVIVEAPNLSPRPTVFIDPANRLWCTPPTGLRAAHVPTANFYAGIQYLYVCNLLMWELNKDRLTYDSSMGV